MHPSTSSILAAVALLQVATASPSGGQSEDCTNPQLSCQASSTPSNTCCYETPGGLVQQVQFWDTNPVTGPSNSWTIHGLWPNNCDGTYSENCDKTRAFKNITQILTAAGDTATLDFMQTYWVSNSESGEAFWEHEWETHGTCMSTLATDCYPDYQTGDEVVDFFDRTVSLFKSLDTYTVSNMILLFLKYLDTNTSSQTLANAGITPDADNSYALSDINDALEKAFGAPVVLQCEDMNVVYEIYYGFNVQGSIQKGNFVPTAQTGSSTNCPDTVMYPPKN
jgi:ribonuclease T2